MLRALVLMPGLRATASTLLAKRSAEALDLALRDKTTTVLEGAFWLKGYSQSALRSRQVPHIGRVSSHFTFRFLQAVQPSLDLL
jgi:hypothetical protein